MYNAPEYGRRINGYISGLNVSKTYCNIDSDKIIETAILPMHKIYIRKTVPADMIDPTMTLDPKEFLTHFISFKHTSLGQKIINGVIAEGIEVDDAMLFYNSYEEVAARLWVDVKTKLPVLYDIEGSACDGTMQQKLVINEFQWGISLEPELFTPDIPADYNLLADIKLDNKNEDMAIEGLRNYAVYAAGQYPSKMVSLTAWKEILEAWQATINWQKRMPNKQERQQNQSILSTCFFYAELEKEGMEPAYYGNNVTADDVNAVLMRWKVSANKYRVIFGDLTIEDISEEQLAMIENNPEFDTILECPRKAAKVQGVIGINISNWPMIKVISDMPAAEAGLKSDDVIVEIYGEDVSGIKTTDEALKFLNGPAGEMLNITVKRNEQTLTFDVNRVPLPKKN